MADCNIRNALYKEHLIIIAGNITSNINANHIEIKINNLPTDYKIILKDDLSDNYITTSNSILSTFNWAKNETDGIIVSDIDNFQDISIQFINSSSIKNSYIFSNEFNVKFDISETIYLKKINNEYLLNNSQFIPYINFQSPIEFYNYNTKYSLNNYQLPEAVIIFLYLQNLSLYDCNYKEDHISICPEILPLLTQSEYDKQLKDYNDKIKNDLILKNIDRCNILSYMAINCNPCLNPMESCPIIKKTNWSKYHESFPLWWVNKNIKTFKSCELSSECQEVCEIDYTLKIIIFNGGPNDLIISNPKGIYSKINCEYKFKSNQYIKIKFIPSPGYIIKTCIGCDRFIDNTAHINFTNSAVIRFYLKKV